MTALPFYLEREGRLAIMRFTDATGGCRPATDAEIAMWDAITDIRAQLLERDHEDAIWEDVDRYQYADLKKMNDCLTHKWGAEHGRSIREAVEETVAALRAENERLCGAIKVLIDAVDSWCINRPIPDKLFAQERFGRDVCAAIDALAAARARGEGE